MLTLPFSQVELGAQTDSAAEVLGVQTDSLLGVQTGSTVELLGVQTDSTGVEEGSRLEGVHQVLV